MADYANNTEDRPHCYIELPDYRTARYVRYEHKYLTNQYLAISEFRVFGKGKGALLKTPANFTAQRDTDRRNAFLNWDKVADAMGYVVYWGIQPDRLNLSAMVYGENAYEIRALNTDQPYYFRVEAFSEHGISAGSSVLSVE